MLKIKGISIIVMFLASALILPVGVSYAQSNNVTTTSVTTMSNQTSTNQTMIQSTSMSNQTNTINQTTVSSTNPTVSQTTVNDTKDVQQISDFVHQAVADFKKQGVETRQVMLDCRDKIQTASPGDVDKIRQDCMIQLNTIKAKYQDARSHFHDLVKQYRQSVMVFINDARGIQVSKAEMDKAFTQLGTMMRGGVSGGMMGHVGKGLMAKNNTHCVNPPGGPAIC